MNLKIARHILALGALMSALAACEEVTRTDVGSVHMPVQVSGHDMTKHSHSEGHSDSHSDSKAQKVSLPKSHVTIPVDAIIGRTIADFELLDEQGNKHSFHDINQGRALVLMTQGNGCPLVRNAMPGLRAVRDVYAAKGVDFYLLNPNIQDDKDSIIAESDAFSFDMRVLIDESQQVGEALLVNRTAEIFVISPDGHRVVYHGPIDDRLNYQTQRAEAKHTYLADALDAVIAGKAIEVKHVSAPGCLINFPDRA